MHDKQPHKEHGRKPATRTLKEKRLAKRAKSAPPPPLIPPRSERVTHAPVSAGH